MSEAMGIKQQTPSVIARLMGLDELPPQKPIHKQQRVLSEDYLRKSASIGLREKQSFYGGRSSRMSSRKQPEFKDVFEVQQKEIHFIQSIPKEKESPSATKERMTFEELKFSDAKCVEMDKKILDIMEFDNMLENIPSDKDILLKRIQQRNILFPNHPHDQQGFQPHSPPGRIAVFKSFIDPNYRKNEKCWKLEKTTAQRNVLRSLQKLKNDSRKDTLEDHHIEMQNFLKTRLKLKDDTCQSPKRIFVLKPNPGNTKYSAKSSFSPRSCLGSQFGDKKKGIPRLVNGELYEVRIVEKPVTNLEPSRRGFRISGGTAKEKGLTRLGTQVIITGSTKLSRSEVGADDTSVNENDVIMPSYSSFFDWKNQNQPSFTRVAKQFSERWKMVKRIQEVGTTNRCRTLGEMLSSSDQKTRPRKLNCKLEKHGLCNKFSLNGKHLDLSSPLGISSKDGMKNDFLSMLSRFRSFSASSDAIGSPISRNHNEAFHNGESLRLEEAVTVAGNSLSNQNFYKKGKSKPGDTEFSCETSQSSSYTDLENNQSVQETQIILNELENRLEDKKLSEENSLVSDLSGSHVPYSDSEFDYRVQKASVIQDELDNSFEESIMLKTYGNNSSDKSSGSSTASGSMIAEIEEQDLVTAIETVDVEFSCKEPNEQQSGPTGCKLMAKDGISSSRVSDTSVGQESSLGSPEEELIFSKIDPEFAASSRDSYQPSPNSILEPPFEQEILSDSEIFESVSSNLQGLWMQLQLLKSEAEDTHSEGPGMMVSSDEGTREGSVDFSKENRKLMGVFKAEESRNFSYLVDVLDEAGFYDANWEINFEILHSPECAVNPSVFEVLEKKYGEQISWKKSERRLLFDRIKSGLMEILQPCMDIRKWANPSRKRIGTQVRRDVVEEELWNLLASQEKEVGKSLSEKTLGGDTRWLEWGDDIDFIVSETEKFLFDELATELDST